MICKSQAYYTFRINELCFLVFLPVKPENVQLKTSAAENKACQGETISINCSADAVPSVTSYQLLENDNAILDTSGRWTKTVAIGLFIYKCVAKNPLGTRNSASVTVIVNGKDNEKMLAPSTIPDD